MIFYCLKTLMTPYCWHKSSSPLSRLAEYVCLWRLSVVLWFPHRTPAFQPHQPIWSFLSTRCFKFLCSSPLCQKYHSPSLSQIIQKTHSHQCDEGTNDDNKAESLANTPTHPQPFTHTHTHTRTPQSWEARPRNSAPIDTESVIRLFR